MAQKDKYKATWVSHSSIKDFLNCPRLYYLRNVYKDPLTGHKITVMKPALAMGQAVHEVVESLSELPVEERLNQSLSIKLDAAWNKIAGKMGGFKDEQDEIAWKTNAHKLVNMVQKNPGPIANKAIKIAQELPHYWLSEDDEIILCGKIDWLEYLPETDSVHIVDFKTGQIEEDEDSLQLPIYHLLVANTQKRAVEKASYWYLQKSKKPTQKKLPDLPEANKTVLEIAKRIKLARQLEHFKCEKGGCRYCLPLEAVLQGKASLVGTSEYNQDIYIL